MDCKAKSGGRTLEALKPRDTPGVVNQTGE